MKLDTRVVPDKLVVGISGDLCYVTFYETKGKKTELNSKKSWTDWSQNSDNPLIVENKFASGFKLAGVNGRWSRQAANAENMLLEHPLFNKCFEISISRFNELANQCIINKGTLELDLIMGKGMSLFTREEYEVASRLAQEKEDKENKLKNTLDNSKISGKDQIPGRIYKDRKSGKDFIYLGSVDIKVHVYRYSAPSNSNGWNGKKEFVRTDTEVRHAYMEVDVASEYRKTTEPHEIVEAFYYNYGGSDTSRKVVDTRKFPSIVHGYGRVSIDKTTATFSASTPYLSVTKTKKPMSLPSEIFRDVNFYDSYTDEDWKLIEEVYNEKEGKDGLGKDRPSWAKVVGDQSINFRRDYLESQK